MYTPSSPHDEILRATPEWYEPFPEPQTIPSGWDMNALLSTSVSIPIIDTPLSPDE
jgi:hypothetical protein